MESISRTIEYAQGDVETEAEYYRTHFGATIRRPDQLEDLVRRLRLDFTPKDILKARAIEEKLYQESWDAEDYDLLPQLRSLTTPTLVLHSTYEFVPLQCASNIAGAMPASQLVVFNDCGHFAYIESPDEVYRAIVDFVSDS
jgi:pimeloyl-ACP methyl ester carboxylesterase